MAVTASNAWMPLIPDMRWSHSTASTGDSRTAATACEPEEVMIAR